jgi:hypothetical protein
VFDGCPIDGGMPIACNQFNPNGVVFEAERGHTYAIMYAKYGTNTGSFRTRIVGPRELLNPNDYNRNGVPDDCDCLFDVNFDGIVDVTDFVLALMNHGLVCQALPCIGDVDGNGMVDEEDYMLILNNQGPCPFPARATLSDASPRPPQK